MQVQVGWFCATRSGMGGRLLDVASGTGLGSAHRARRAGPSSHCVLLAPGLIS